MDRVSNKVFSHPRWLKNISVVSQLQNVRRVQGAWRHEFIIPETKEMIAREYVTGAFVTLDGQIREPADGLVDASLLGDPPSHGRNEKTL